MGRRSEEPVKYLVIGQRASHRNLILVAGMPADGEIQLVKDTVPGHKALAGAAFLTGTAEKYHSPLFSILLQVFLYGKPPEGPDAELCRQLGRRLGRQKLINTIQMLQTYRGACAYNVGVSHVLGALAVELEELL